MMFTSRLRLFAAGLTLALTVTACGPKDGDIKIAADSAVASMPGIAVAVEKGVATISGEFADDAAKAAAEASVKAVKGVTSVVNNGTVAPPPAPVVISPDEALKTGVDAVLKDFSTLTAEVMDGVVTLNGEVKRSDLPTVMQAITALQPKKIDNKATVKQ
jgi:hyperosmotically inducible periplasmic protein